tara:strand:- start:21 stop:308 length:288 start_codon:yes stop_codon:yes gene_type:complete
MNYFNTNCETGTTLGNSIKKVTGQDKTITALFNSRPLSMYTADEVLKYSRLPNRTPLTSVRRSLTVLTKKGALIKTDTQKMGSYGKMCYCYMLKS